MAFNINILPDLSNTKERLTARWNGEQVVELWFVIRPLIGDPFCWFYKFFRLFNEIPITAHAGVLVLLANGTYHLIERGKGHGPPGTKVTATLTETSQAIIDGETWDSLKNVPSIQDGPMIHEVKKFRDDYISSNKYHWWNENCQKFAPLSSQIVLAKAKDNRDRRLFRWMAAKYGALSVPLVPCVFYFLWRRRRVGVIGSCRLRILGRRSGVMLGTALSMRRGGWGF
ncbi:hypothetical protein TWF718_010885 [Orbilia javanica]|uniref:Uncharacterized protein n=1 Tax=Orbilia javanica TaxID=47235 RepID=A0AAN8RAB4_9PEZI